jgi:hypothetical protein
MSDFFTNAIQNNLATNFIKIFHYPPQPTNSIYFRSIVSVTPHQLEKLSKFWPCGTSKAHARQ